MCERHFIHMRGVAPDQHVILVSKCRPAEQSEELLKYRHEETVYRCDVRLMGLYNIPPAARRPVNPEMWVTEMSQAGCFYALKDVTVTPIAYVDPAADRDRLLELTLVVHRINRETCLMCRVTFVQRARDVLLGIEAQAENRRRMRAKLDAIMNRIDGLRNATHTAVSESDIVRLKKQALAAAVSRGRDDVSIEIVPSGETSQPAGEDDGEDDLRDVDPRLRDYIKKYPRADMLTRSTFVTFHFLIEPYVLIAGKFAWKF
jgi:hypothetical protein